MKNCINCKHFKTPKAKVWKVGKCLKTSVHKLKGDVCEKFEAQCLFQVGDEVEYRPEYQSVVGHVLGVVVKVNGSNSVYPVVIETKGSQTRLSFTPDGRYVTGSPQVLFKVNQPKTL